MAADDDKTSGGVVPFRPKPGAHTATVAGIKVVLSDIVPALGTSVEEMAAEEGSEGARLIMGPAPDDPFRFLWVYDLDRKTLAGYRVTDGNEKHYGPAKDDVSLIVRLEKKGHLNRLDSSACRRIESEMRSREQEAERSLKQYIEENESNFQKIVNDLTKRYFDEVVRPKIDRALADVARGATPIGFKPMDIPRPIEEQKRVHVLSSIMGKELTTAKVDAYLIRHGVDVDAGDSQASYWALHDVMDAAYEEYINRHRMASVITLASGGQTYRFDRSKAEAYVRRKNEDPEDSIVSFGGFFEYTFEIVDVSKIHPEEVWKDAKIERVLADIDAGKNLEPIHLTRENGRLLINDGIHRYNASLQRGFKKIPAIISQWIKREPPKQETKDKLGVGQWVKLHKPMVERGETFEYGVITSVLGNTSGVWRYEVALVHQGALDDPDYNDLLDLYFEPVSAPSWGRSFKAAAKPEFFSPATFKKVAERFLSTLEASTEFPWRLHGIQKSNRKTIEGVETYLSAKLYPADRDKQFAAEISASMLAGMTIRYLGSIVVDRSTRPFVEEHHDGKDFADLAKWLVGFKVPNVKVAAVAERFKVAGMADDLKKRVEDLLADYTAKKSAETAKWLMENFTFATRHTPKGQQRTKQELERLHKIITIGAEYAQAQNAIPFARQSLLEAWGHFEPHLENAAAYFTSEGGRKTITREITKGGNTYVNLAGASDKALNEMIDVVEDCFSTLKGWRRKALAGGVRVVFADSKSFGGTASGKYKENEDSLYIRATSGGRISRAEPGKYGSLSYVIVHELGHRYERKHRTNTDFDKPEWWTSRYSTKEGEGFAELFAISNFGLTAGQCHGTWTDDRVEKFDKVVG